MKQTSQEPGLGSPAPPLALPSADVGSVSLADHAGQAVLVSFLSHAA